jgi:hypothetical protein
MGRLVHRRTQTKLHTPHELVPEARYVMKIIECFKSGHGLILGICSSVVILMPELFLVRQGIHTVVYIVLCHKTSNTYRKSQYISIYTFKSIDLILTYQ